LGTVAAKAKALTSQAAKAVSTTVQETVQHWQGQPEQEVKPDTKTETPPTPQTPPAASAAPPIADQPEGTPPETPLNEPAVATAPPSAEAPAKKTVMAWVKQSIPGVGAAMDFIDDQMKTRFLKELLEQTEATSLLPRLNGYAKEDLQAALTQHTSRDRAFYRTVFRDVSEWVNKQESRRQYATAESFLNEHWTQLVQQSETVQQFQARMAVYTSVADILAAQDEIRRGRPYLDETATPVGLGTDWRVTFKQLDDIQQTHPPLWQLMTVLGKGAVRTQEKSQDKQVNTILLGDLMVQLLSLRDSVQPNRFRMMAQWLDKVPQEKLEAFVQESDNYNALRTDLGVSLPEAWWERYHREQLAKPDSVNAPAATLMRALYELSDMITPAF
jgi:hypothetical protein